MSNKNMPGGRIRLPKCKEHNKPQHLCEKCITAARVALQKQAIEQERQEVQNENLSNTETH